MRACVDEKPAVHCQGLNRNFAYNGKPVLDFPQQLGLGVAK